MILNGKTYQFYKISWVDITGSSEHATREEFDKMECATMVTYAFVYKRDYKFIWTFSSYDVTEETFSDRNVFPTSCVTDMKKLDV